MYHGYIGWFSGRPADLHPLSIREEARRLVELAGGRWEHCHCHSSQHHKLSVKMLWQIYTKLWRRSNGSGDLDSVT